MTNSDLVDALMGLSEKANKKCCDTPAIARVSRMIMIVPTQDTGTSEGAKKGWEHRRHGGGGTEGDATGINQANAPATPSAPESPTMKPGVTNMRIAYPSDSWNIEKFVPNYDATKYATFSNRQTVSDAEWRQNLRSLHDKWFKNIAEHEWDDIPESTTKGLFYDAIFDKAREVSSDGNLTEDQIYDAIDDYQKEYDEARKEYKEQCEREDEAHENMKWDTYQDYLKYFHV